MSINGRYAEIKPNDVVDGEGICVSFWVQGCPFHCNGCHNPTTWSFDGGYPFTEKTMDQLLMLILKNGIKRNFSILGGEPLCPENLEMTTFVVHIIRQTYPDIKIYLWTGYIYENIQHLPVLKDVDILIDGQFDLAHRDITLKLRGSPNQRIIKLYK